MLKCIQSRIGNQEGVLDLKFSNHFKMLGCFERHLRGSVGQELSGNDSNKDHRKLAEHLPRTYRKFSEKL